MQTYLIDIDDTVYSRTNQLDDDLQNLENITPFDGVEEFCMNNKPVFVSKGDPLLQMKKLRILGLLHTANAVHIVPSNKGKQAAFNLYDRSVVLGNRRDAEIRYGNMSGHYTVLIKHGKYADLPVSTVHDAADEEHNEMCEYLHKH